MHTRPSDLKILKFELTDYYFDGLTTEYGLLVLAVWLFTRPHFICFT